MESDDDYQLFSPSEEPSSPIHKPKLKRLKRTSTGSSEPTAQFVDPSHANDSYSTGDLHSELLESTDLEEAVEPIFESEDLVTVGDSVYDQDGMVSDRDQTETGGTLHVEKQAQLDDLNVANDESDGKEDQSNDFRENGGNLDAGEFANVRKCSDGGEKDEKKKKKRGKSDGEDGKPEASARTKKRMEKERKIHIERLHAETQRLLRETRDASFKPVPLVQKPISSVLEKIRKRKLEISKKASISNSCSETDCASREAMLNVHRDYVGRNGQTDDKSAEETETDLNVANGEDNHLEGPSGGRSSDPVSPSDQCENVSSSMALDEKSITFRNPINDTQDIFNGSESFDEEDVQPDSPLEEEFAPSLLAMNLKFDSAPPEEISSDEEDDDKENMDPHLHKMVGGDLCPNGDLAKAFVDDEAEEEDDSDDDPMRSQENEEDEENGESEEFNDLIVPVYKENPIDNEKRDQLHQKWLEQQDAAATENVLQRIKCGLKQSEATMFEEVEEDDEFDEDSENEAAADLLPKSVARINSKKAKQMIPQMFSDKDDGFVSDDEETEQNLVRQRLLEKADKHATFLSPAEDESSREVFGLIKKLNIVPDTKKKAKSSSYFDKVISGGNSNSSLKSSFLGRVRSNSLAASNKHGSSNVRSFIFGRDDSNSRSGISASEVSSDVEKRGNQPKRNASAKFSSSQSKISSQSTITSETSSGSSLLEILRRSSVKFDQKQDSTVGQTQAVIQFAAFKSRKKIIKMESRK